MSDNEQPNPTPDDAPDETPDKDGLLEAGRTLLKSERDARKAAERELTALRKRLDDLEGKDKSDVERIAGERDQLRKDLEDQQKRVRRAAGKAAALEAARSANAIAPTAVYALIRDDLEFDDDDEPTNLDALLIGAKKQEPALFQAVSGSGDGGRGGNGKSTVDGATAVNQWIRQQGAS
jgi:hypothetical protein